MQKEQVSKCPACGAMRNSFEAVCPECGYEFTDVQTSQSLREFTDKIEQLDRDIAQRENPVSKGFGCWTVVAWIFLFPIMLGVFLFRRVLAKHEVLKGFSKMKADTIINYPVPNSKQDLLEFALLVDNHIQTINYISALTDAGMETQRWNKIWANKANLVEKKASIALKDDRSALNEVVGCCQSAKAKYDSNEKVIWTAIGALCVIFVIFLILFIVK